MTKLVFCFFVFLSCDCFAQQTLKSIDSLASIMEMEFVYGDKVPLVNAFDYYGATAVFDFALKERWSGLFLFRKLDNVERAKRNLYLDPYNDYDYSLVFYWKDSTGQLKHYILPLDVSLIGMSLHYGNTNMELSKFRYLNGTKLSRFKYLDGKKEFGPPIKATLSNGCIPIIISGSTVTRVLYYYKERWLEKAEWYD